MNPRIRIASDGDAEGILKIYNPCILTTAITFEETPLTLEQMRARMAEVMAKYPWLVCVGDDNSILAYAYGSSHAVRASYRWSVDVAIYAHPTRHRQGIGRSLYKALFGMLREQGYVNAYAGISLPNAASVGFHESAGFKPAGIMPRAGFKLGAWRDVGWWHLELLPPTGSPPEPIPFPAVARRGLPQFS